MKPQLFLPLSLLALVAIGCGGQEQSSSTNELGTQSRQPASGKKITVGIVFDAGGKGDKSFNDSAWAGIERAKRDLTITEKSVNSKSEKDYEDNLTSLAEGGCDLVFAIGMNMQSALEKVALAFPNTKFAIVDAEVKGPNIRSLLFKEEEGSFLAGYVAGLATKTNKIGFVGGKEIDLIKKFYYGYAAGAKTSNPKIEVLAAKYTGSWDNADNAKAATLSLYGEGADVVYQAAGRAGQGVINAAKTQTESGKVVYAIGVDQDQDDLAPGSVLTSMVKRVDESVFQTIKDLKNGKFTGETKTYDLKDDGVGITQMKYTKDKVSAEGLANLKKIEEKIKKGEFKVPATEKEYSVFNPPTIKK
jgi:basic membrane protein A